MFICVLSILTETSKRTRLLTVKSKIAPLKSQTIPRLELSGVLLLASLTATIQQALPVKINRTVYWTDSTIVLHCLNSSPHAHKTLNELKELHNLLKSDDHNEKVNPFLADKQIEWRFMSPHSPQFVGLWEAAAKSFKHHFRCIVGNKLLTFEQFNIIIKIESVLNCRPLTPISTDLKDLLALIPGDFRIDNSLRSLRKRDFGDTPSNWFSRWQHIQQIKHF